ncbi:winged helix-turn-helix domain-containing protein [Plantactinospora sp. B6F1]|uniref:winged helix-turn-helix domain-containing protein n=1 Tax=Plantactinospora sp. B6F1 TaxID=3158971 RepID=UPI0032D97FF8
MTSRPADYLRVVEAITDQIRSGELTPGDKLPSYSQLAGEYNVSISTTQAALRILRERGLVEGHQGKGTYVTQNPPLA